MNVKAFKDNKDSLLNKIICCNPETGKIINWQDQSSEFKMLNLPLGIVISETENECMLDLRGRL